MRKEIRRQTFEPEPVPTITEPEEIVTEEAKEVEVPETEEAEAEVVNVKQFLNIRKEPSLKEGTVLTMLEKGTKIIVTNKTSIKNDDGEWYKVKVSDPEFEGYAMKKYIKVYQ